MGQCRVAPQKLRFSASFTPKIVFFEDFTSGKLHIFLARLRFPAKDLTFSELHEQNPTKFKGALRV